MDFKCDELIFGKKDADSRALTIDVRTAEEFSAEHVASAKNIEYQQIVPAVAKLGIGKQEPIQLYCRSGRRAEIARGRR